MKINGSLTLAEGGKIDNMGAPFGSTFPIAQEGELFVLKGHATLNDGLYFMQWASACYVYCRTLKNSVLVCTNPSDAWDIYKANNDYLWPSRDLGGTLTLKYKTIPPAV